jgi:TATA-binding protein-associated factor
VSIVRGTPMRLLTLDSLQRFKIDVASTVVNQQNAALGNMETDQLLDLFNVSSSETAGDVAPLPAADATGGEAAAGVSEHDAVDATGEVRLKGKRDLLDDMQALWDESQYREEYDLDAFLASMKV